jgi:hypothetical protein
MLMTITLTLFRKLLINRDNFVNKIRLGKTLLRKKRSYLLCSVIHQVLMLLKFKILNRTLKKQENRCLMMLLIMLLMDFQNFTNHSKNFVMKRWSLKKHCLIILFIGIHRLKALRVHLNLPMNMQLIFQVSLKNMLI